MLLSARTHSTLWLEMPDSHHGNEVPKHWLPECSVRDCQGLFGLSIVSELVRFSQRTNT